MLWEQGLVGECQHTLFEFSQTITQQKQKHVFFFFFLENSTTKQRKQLVFFDCQNVISFCSCHHYVNNLCQLCFKLLKHNFKLTSVHIFFGLFLKHDTNVFLSGAYEYKSYTTVHPKSVAARSTHTYYERNKGKPLYVGNLTWVGLSFDSCWHTVVIKT